MVTFWLLIDTIAMIGSPASRGAVVSAAGSGRAGRAAASVGGAAVSAVKAAVARSATTAEGVHLGMVLVDGPIVNRLVMPCSRCQRGIAFETNAWSARMVPVLRPAVNQTLASIRAHACP